MSEIMAEVLGSCNEWIVCWLESCPQSHIEYRIKKFLNLIFYFLWWRFQTANYFSTLSGEFEEEVIWHNWPCPFTVFFSSSHDSFKPCYHFISLFPRWQYKPGQYYSLVNSFCLLVERGMTYLLWCRSFYTLPGNIKQLLEIIFPGLLLHNHSLFLFHPLPGSCIPCTTSDY